MNNKYVKQITNEDIKTILEKCGYSLCENLKDRDSKPLNAIDRFADKILVRCIAPEEPNNENNGFLESIYKKNPNLVKKLIGTMSLLSTFGSANNAEFLIVEDFIAQFPFEEDETLPKSRKINNAYYELCVEKFGDKFIKDYVEYTKQFIKDIENENKM